jgi:hypothetical protein
VKRQSALVEPVYGYTADDVNPGSGREDLLHRNRAAVDASVRYDWTDAVGDLRGYFGEVAQLYADAAAAGEAVVKVIS